MVKVRAKTKGYVGNLIREIGEVFEWPEGNKVGKWVEPVAFGGRGDHDGDGLTGGSKPHEAGAGEGKSSAPAGVVVPADWSSLHHSKRKALAKAISGAPVHDLAVADNIIAAHVEANKPAPFADAPEPQTVAQAMKGLGTMQPDWVDPSAPKAVAD